VEAIRTVVEEEETSSAGIVDRRVTRLLTVQSPKFVVDAGRRDIWWQTVKSRRFATTVARKVTILMTVPSLLCVRDARKRATRLPSVLSL